MLTHELEAALDERDSVRRRLDGLAGIEAALRDRDARVTQLEAAVSDLTDDRQRLDWSVNEGTLCERMLAVLKKHSASPPTAALGVQSNNELQFAHTQPFRLGLLLNSRLEVVDDWVWRGLSCVSALTPHFLVIDITAVLCHQCKSSYA